ncbi:hypothetical protein M9458_032760, partial [Cirrhinus mrigala]
PWLIQQPIREKQLHALGFYYNVPSTLSFILTSSPMTKRGALQWADALWNSENPLIYSLSVFTKHFTAVFCQATTEISMHDELLRFRQANLTIHDYTLRFRTLEASSGRGLNPLLRQHMAIYEDSVSLENFLQKASHISQHITACHMEHSPTATASPEPAPPAPGPMITENYHLSRAEQARRITNGLCLYCSIQDHYLRTCPVRPPHPAVSTVNISPSVSCAPYTDALLTHNSTSFPVKETLSHLTLSTGSIYPARKIKQPARLPIFKENHWERGLCSTAPPELVLDLGCLHSERTSLLVLEEANVDVVLERPWLTKHDPLIDWRSGEIRKWSSRYFRECLKELPKPVITTTHLPICYTSVESPNSSQTLSIPPEYQAFQDVFSKVAATHLPPHRPWDCAIDLLPGAKLPKGRVYPLSIPERAAMEEYIQEALQQGFIRPSTSPAASSFFFVAKKDGGLRPCIDYRALNEQVNLIRIRRGDEWKIAFITPTGHYEYRVMPYGLSNSPSIFQNFMNKIYRDMLHQFVIIYIDDILIYSPPLQDHRRHVNQVLQRLREHHLYLKAEKCKFHKTTIHFLGYIVTPAGVQMDQRKVDAVRNWPLPTTIKEMQRFLGFANFYRRFISHYNQLSAPLTSLIRQKNKNLSRTPEAHQVFQDLKQAFCAAPALTHPDPNLRFVVEVDAATLGVGAVLSQWRGEPPILHPCAFFSKKLSPAEQNYDVGNRELLAMKLSLEEWRHWLEGAQPAGHSFFTRFHFTITYRPGNKNTKADALSRLHQPDPQPDEQESILPASVFVSPITWALDSQIEATTRTEPAPPGGPEGKIFVPTSLRHSLLDSVHTSLRSGHPGSYRTLSLLKNRYWWPNMARDVARYVKGCSVCAISSTPLRLPEGKLVPLPIPRRPWSHLGVDFATDLPPSNRYTTIFVVVDRFSKACKLIPLRGPPTALEAAEALFLHVFHNFGLPEDIMSDRGPQFISRVWRGFFRLLGVFVSLSSGYHPQTNGQTERKIQEIRRYLWAYCHEHQDTWSQFLPWAEYAQISLRQDPTGLTPFQCVLGFQPLLFPWSGELSEVPAVDYWFQESERVWDSAHVHLQREIRRHKNNADAHCSNNPIYQPGDRVWLSTQDIRLRLPSKKLSPWYIGPFPTARQINE